MIVLSNSWYAISNWGTASLSTILIIRPRKSCASRPSAAGYDNNFELMIRANASLKAYALLPSSAYTVAWKLGFPVVSFNAAMSLKTSNKLSTSAIISSFSKLSNNGKSPNSPSTCSNIGIKYLLTALGTALKNKLDAGSSINTSTIDNAKSINLPCSSPNKALKSKFMLAKSNGFCSNPCSACKSLPNWIKSP